MQRLTTQRRCRRVLSVLAALTLHATVLYGLWHSVHPVFVPLDMPVSILLVSPQKVQAMTETVPIVPTSQNIIGTQDRKRDAGLPQKPPRKTHLPGMAVKKNRSTPIPAHSTDPETVQRDHETLLPSFNDQSVNPSESPEIANKSKINNELSIESPVKNDQIDQNYINTIMSALEKFKKYPEISRKRHEEGTVTLIFTIDRSGRIIVHDLYKTSGHTRLDDAALYMLAQTPSLPAIPASYQRDLLTLILPISFNIRT